MEGFHVKIGITQMGGRVAMLDLDTCSSHDGDGLCHHFYDHQIPFETFSLLLNEIESL